MMGLVMLPDALALGRRGFFVAGRPSKRIPVRIDRSNLSELTVDRRLHFWYTEDATGEAGEYLKIEEVSSA